MKAYTNVNLVTCDSAFHVYRDGLLVVEDDRIAYCGPYDENWLWKCSERVDYEGAWIMPGLAKYNPPAIHADCCHHESRAASSWPSEYDS